MSDFWNKTFNTSKAPLLLLYSCFLCLSSICAKIEKQISCEILLTGLTLWNDPSSIHDGAIPKKALFDVKA